MGSLEHLKLVEELRNADVVAPAVDLADVALEECEMIGVKTLFTKTAVKDCFDKVIAF